MPARHSPKRKRKPVPVFVSYAHKDMIRCDELREHLSDLVRNEVLHVWWDGMIDPKIPWASDIKKNLRAAKIVVLLISSRFLASWYCNEMEVKEAVERHKKGKTIVVPVLLRKCHYKNAPFAKFDPEPKKHKTVTGNRDRRDAAWTEVAEKLEAIAKRRK